MPVICSLVSVWSVLVRIEQFFLLFFRKALVAGLPYLVEYVVYSVLTFLGFCLGTRLAVACRCLATSEADFHLWPLVAMASPCEVEHAVNGIDDGVNPCR